MFDASKSKPKKCCDAAGGVADLVATNDSPWSDRRAGRSHSHERHRPLVNISDIYQDIDYDPLLPARHQRKSRAPATAAVWARSEAASGAPSIMYSFPRLVDKIVFKEAPVGQFARLWKVEKATELWPGRRLSAAAALRSALPSGFSIAPIRFA
jgi:hypothetical protein